MAKKRRKVSRKRKTIEGMGFNISKGIPKKGLLDPALRRDIGNVPGLAPTK